MPPTQRWLFIGDSITAAHRSDQEPLGRGYVHLLHCLLRAQHPELPIVIENAGQSGHTVRDLKRRWSADVIARRPDQLIVSVGINDVWRAFEPGREDQAVPLSEYVETLTTLVAQAKASRPMSALLLTPFLIEPSPHDPFRQAVLERVAAVRDVGEQLGVPVVSLQEKFDAALAHRPPAEWSDDRVHVTLEGHMLIALATLEALERSGPGLHAGTVL